MSVKCCAKNMWYKVHTLHIRIWTRGRVVITLACRLQFEYHNGRFIEDNIVLERRFVKCLKSQYKLWLTWISRLIRGSISFHKIALVWRVPQHRNISNLIRCTGGNMSHIVFALDDALCIYKDRCERCEFHRHLY